MWNGPVKFGYGRSLDFLRACRGSVTSAEAIRPIADGEPFRWKVIVESLDEVT
jgi:hypothetical protein